MALKNACWAPGTDHASIATEAKVVKKLAGQGIKKSDLTREEFLKHAWEWTDEHGGIILKQLRKLGASCDWDRTSFTMDETRSASVIKVFCDYFVLVISNFYNISKEILDIVIRYQTIVDKSDYTVDTVDIFDGVRTSCLFVELIAVVFVSNTVLRHSDTGSVVREGVAVEICKLIYLAPSERFVSVVRRISNIIV
jgi:hypothetical protein